MEAHERDQDFARAKALSLRLMGESGAGNDGSATDAVGHIQEATDVAEQPHTAIPCGGDNGASALAVVAGMSRLEAPEGRAQGLEAWAAAHAGELAELRLDDLGNARRLKPLHGDEPRPAVADIQSPMELPDEAPEPEYFPLSATWDGSELLSLHLPPQDLIFRPWAPLPGIVGLYGPQKSLKTTVALTMGLSMATGAPFLGFRPSRALRVLYCNFEGHAGQVVEKCCRLLGVREPEGLKLLLPPGQFRLLHLIGLRGSNGESVNLAEPQWQRGLLDELRLQIGRGTGPEALFIDNVSTAFRGIDENSNSEVAAVNYFLEELRELGLLVVFLHHTGKLGKGELARHKKPRGASAWSAAVDTTVALQRKDAEDDELGPVTVEWSFDDERGQLCRPRSFLVTLEDYGHEQCGPGEKPFLRLTAAKVYPERVLKYLNACAETVGESAGDLKRVLGVSRATCFSWAAQAADMELVAQDARTRLLPAGWEAIGRRPPDD